MTVLRLTYLNTCECCVTLQVWGVSHIFNGNWPTSVKWCKIALYDWLPGIVTSLKIKSKIKVNVYKDKLIVQCINSLPALPILAYNFDDLDRDQPNILVSFAMPVCHVMQTYTLIVKASKTFETNYR